MDREQADLQIEQQLSQKFDDLGGAAEKMTEIREDQEVQLVE